MIESLLIENNELKRVKSNANVFWYFEIDIFDIFEILWMEIFLNATNDISDRDKKKKHIEWKFFYFLTTNLESYFFRHFYAGL